MRDCLRGQDRRHPDGGQCQDPAQTHVMDTATTNKSCSILHTSCFLIFYFPIAEALNALKKKKLYEGQFNQLDGQILNLDQTIFALEKSIINQEIVQAQKAASHTLKDQVAQMGYLPRSRQLSYPLCVISF